MRLAKTFEHIESIKFAINFSVISGWRIFQQALEENDTLRALIDDLKQHPTHKRKVFARLIILAKTKTDPAIEHPHDIALAAYLFALSRADIVLAYVATAQLQRLPNLWWSQRLAKAVRESLSTATVQTDVMDVAEHRNVPKVTSTSLAKNSDSVVIRFPTTVGNVLRPPQKVVARAS